MKEFFLKLISDEKGNLSSAKFTNLMIGMAAIAISWKLVLTSGYNEGYFALLLAYGGSVYSVGKFADKKKEDQ